MDKLLAVNLEQKLGISTVQIVREEYELLILKRIFESNLGNMLVFRGGTALRLAYGSPRFSDDLDFSQLKNIDPNVFRNWAGSVAKYNSNIEVAEVRKKYFTLFSLFKVKDPVLTSAISIKIEISRRKEKWEKGKDYKLLGLKSEVTPLTVLTQVAVLERIEREKWNIPVKRIRDLFDIWFIGQSLGKMNPMDFSGWKAKEIKRELYRLLPKKSIKLIEPWLPKE